MDDKTSRILITTECNLKCSYCCNKLPEVQSTFKMTTIDMFLNMNYDVINISGGEPLLAPNKLNSLLQELHHKGNNRVYLYTNGVLTEDLHLYARNLDGVNIGCHGNWDTALEGAIQWRKHIRSVRFHAQKGKMKDYHKRQLIKHGVKLNEWTMNECNNINEDRYIV